MGLFDTVYSEYPLPNERHQDLDFQTKNLECLMDTYTITRDGRLVRHAGRGWGGANLDRDVEWPLHGDIRIYTSVKTEDPSWVEYVVRFTHGRVEWIRPLTEVQSDSDLPSPDWDLSLDSYAIEQTAEVEAQPDPITDIPALTDEQLAGAITEGVRKRLMLGQVDSGEDITALRRFIGLTQVQFAQAMGISVRTLQSWEQGRRYPEGPAIALLRIAARHPRIIRENVTHGESAA